MRRDKSILVEDTLHADSMRICADALYGGEPIQLRHDRTCRILMVYHAPLFDWSVLGVWQVDHGWLLADKDKPEVLAVAEKWLTEEMPCTCNHGCFDAIRSLGHKLGRTPEESEAKIAKLRAGCLGCAQ